jgi:Zn-finger nucleic acid-binding protein
MKNTRNRLSAKKVTACIILSMSLILGYQYRYALLKKAFIQPRGICTFYRKDSMNTTEYHDYINHGGNANDIVNVTWFDEDNDISTYYSLLQCAVAFDRIEIAKLLLDRGADPNIYSQNSEKSRVTALHLATQKERYAKRKKSYEFSKLLLESGANPNLFDENGNTPLHKLVEREEDFLPEYSYNTNEIIKILDLFMKYRVNINLANHDGDTALHIAAREKTISVYDRMVAFGWNPEQLNKKGESAKELLKSANSK